MNRRQRDVALLLGSILDAPFAQARNWTPELVRKNAIRGEVPAHRVPCPACLGEKRRRVRTVLLDCDRCIGAKGKPLGYIVVDGMIDERWRRRIGTIETGLQMQFKHVGCDVCGGSGRTLSKRWRGENDRCERCHGAGEQVLLRSAWQSTRFTVPAELQTPVGDAVIAAMEARSRSGSYDELELAMRELRVAWPALYRLVLDRFVLQLALRSERLERLATEGGLVFLSERMPDEIRVPAGVRARAKELAA